MTSRNSNRQRRLRATVASVAVAVAAAVAQTAMAQVGTWKAYMSYNEPQQIVKAGNELFVRASNSLYTYNLDDQSITTYDKVKGLSDTSIKLIAWNATVQKLLIVYANSNIDLMDRSGNVLNVSALFNKAMTEDKTINDVTIEANYAYLATGFGMVKLDMEQGIIAESLIMHHNATDIAISQQTIYLKTLDTYTVDPKIDNADIAPGTVVKENISYDRQNRPTQKTVTISCVYAGQMGTNLINANNWTPNATAPDNIFADDNSDWQQYIDTVGKLQPDGPTHNYFGVLKLNNGKLYSCGGGWDSNNDLKRPATIQIYDTNSNSWQALPNVERGIPGTESSTWAFIDMMSVNIDPNNPQHIIGTGRTGMFEYLDGEFVKYWNKDNSLLKNATSSNSNRYVLTLGSLYDHNGDLWCLVSQTKGDNLVKYSSDQQWTAYSQDKLYIDGVSLNGMKAMFEDSRQLIWFVNEHYTMPSVYCYDPASNKIVMSFTTIVNQDGTSYAAYAPYCVTEDLDHNIWIGTNEGPFILEAERVGRHDDSYLTQFKVPRNDGTNYADYLMAGTTLRSIIIDGGGRKWMGTSGNGLYLISADNMTELAHFTTANSSLLSNNIEAMAINNATGELFIGTDVGLCSYMTDATTANDDMDKDNVYAYPNPVTPDHTGLITIVGLSLDADVKILSSSGKLIAQGRSNGGTFTWNGCDSSGKRVASGIYMVASATKDGKKGTVCKIAIVN